MKKPRHNGKILAIVIIGVIVVFAAGIGLGDCDRKKGAGQPEGNFK